MVNLTLEVYTQPDHITFISALERDFVTMRYTYQLWPLPLTVTKDNK